MTVTSLAVVEAPAAAGEPLASGGPEGAEAWGAEAEPEPVPWEDSPPAPLVLPGGTDGPLEGEVEAAAESPEFPVAAVWQVELGAVGETAAVVEGSVAATGAGVADDDVADGLPVAIASGIDAAAGEHLQVEVLDRATAQAAGVSGFVFTVDAAGSDASIADIAGAQGLPAQVEIDYSGFAGAYGGDYASRLQVVALPACALTQPRPDGCLAQGTRVEVDNDLEAGRLTLDVPDLATLAADQAAATADLQAMAAGIGPLDGGSFGEADLAREAAQAAPPATEVPEELAPFESGPAQPPPSAPADSPAGSTAPAAAPVGEDAVVFAVTSAVGGDMGNYAATPMSMSSAWNVTPGSGEFSYSYPLDVPQPAGGAAPSVALGYSSGAVDGLTLGTNTQAPQTGVGWSEFANGFISRAYEPCANQGFPSQDLCWADWNATISLGGISGVLTPIDADYREWRAKNDPGWRVQRFGDPGGPGLPGVYGGEYWKVTAPDGTQYFFGLHFDPDTGRQTNGGWWVPVVANNPTDPCWNTEDNALGVCHMAWQWNLDRVVDPNGNLTTYWYSREVNRYELLNGIGNRYGYIRSGMLSRIEYGDRAGDPSAEPTARVTFGLQDRCVYLAEACPAADSGGSDAAFPDVPWDLICDVQPICPTLSPSFFSGRRYSHVRTEVLVGTAWEPVQQYNLIHRIVMHSQTAGKMYLDKIQQVGIVDGGRVPYPATVFGFQQHANRADVTSGVLRMVHWRVAQVANPFGGRVDVTYFRNRPCSGGDFLLDWWDHNDKDCFPQTVYDDNHRRRGIFNKFLVQQVVESPGHGSPPMTTTYSYEGTAAWAFDFGAFDRHEDRTGWSQWRGYDTTLVTQGISQTRIRVFRGMDGDVVSEVHGGQRCACGTRTVDVQSLDGSLTFSDRAALAGRTLEQASLGTLGGVADVALQSTLYEYEVRQTADPVDDDFDSDAPHWADVSASTESVAVTPTTFRQRGTRSTYNANLQPAASDELGWLDVTGDERCSRTTYAQNPALGMSLYPATNQTVAGTCDAPGAELAYSETYYDGSTTLGDAPTRGNPTRQRTKLDGAGGGTFAVTGTTFDALGRPLAVTDARGNTTTTSYTASPAHALPTQTVVTNDLGHATTTTLMPEYSVPLGVDGPNASDVTTYAYDALGRLSAVRSPTEQGLSGADTRSARFSYLLSFDSGTGGAGAAPPIVRSQQLAEIGSDGIGDYEDSWVVYDGNLRERQTQVVSPSSGDSVLATTTSYDGRGLVRDEVVPEGVEATPGTGLVEPPAGATWANRTRRFYDALGRATREQWMRGATEVPDRATAFAYDEDTVTVTGPGASGEQSVRADTVDGLGRTVEVRELDHVDGGSEVWATTTYGYDLADNLTSITDAEGNAIGYTYNMVGWRTGQADPNRGAASYAYDLAGNQVMTQDANSAQVWTNYDDLGRPIERRSGSASGPLLASWTYDTAPGGVGQLHRSTRHTPGGSWVSEAVGYDERGRATGTALTVPASVPGLAGTYQVDQAYDRADRPTVTTYAATGNLPAEAVTTHYDSLGFPRALTGAQDYARRTRYDSHGRVSSMTLGPPDPEGVFFVDDWLHYEFQYDVDQQLSAVETFELDMTELELDLVSRHEIGYDDAGRVTGRTAEVPGLGSWRECYGYDRRSRLVSAFTVEVAATCAAGTPGTGGQPFEQSFAYTPGNAIDERADGAVVTDYSYGATGAGPPYAPVQVGGVSLEWDANGNLVERSEGGSTETFAWDVEQRLASVSGPGGVSSFVYDAGGQRLLRETPAGRTLYFAGQEITASLDGSSVTWVRSYSFAGRIVATRTPAGFEYLLVDERGSVEMSAVPFGLPQTARAYEPYGGELAASGSGFATDRGFLGQVEDDSTDLSYLGARYYDAASGVFVSPDPVYDTGNPRSLNPYTYGLGAPTTFSDASGLSASYILGLENQNIALRAQNSALVAHIGTLNGHLREMQSVIRRQQTVISQLLTHISALENVIRQQQAVIRNLQAKVRQLAAQVAYWRGRAMYWRGRAAYWQGQAKALGTRSFGRGALTVPMFSGGGSGRSESGCGALDPGYDCRPVRGWVTRLDNVSFYDEAIIGMESGYPARVSIRQLNPFVRYDWEVCKATECESIAGSVNWQTVELYGMGERIGISSSIQPQNYDAVWPWTMGFDYPWAQLKLEVWAIVDWKAVENRRHCAGVC